MNSRIKVTKASTKLNPRNGPFAVNRLLLYFIVNLFIPLVVDVVLGACYRCPVNPNGQFSW